ncbi:Growth-regulating factor 6 [Rhynchospora pubera]|uniref:Growth-regulating factor n=1 Tax=Rhynchospora pubera TaxID=906938 RepID=A0AAV8HB10_9POAL|nr:Growth-regulating factor 6 [Rhynchospora pubera]
MDFGGVLTMDTLLASSSSSSSSMNSNNGAFSEHNKGIFGSSGVKHARSSGDLEATDLGFLKMARTEMKMRHEDSKYSSCRPGTQSLFPGGTQMLSFSSPGKESASALSIDGSLPYHHHHSSQSSLEHSYFKNGNGSMNSGVLSRIRGPFTPSQWMELEHQALIYKYIVANAPVPTTLLIPIRRSLAPAAFSPFSSFASGPLGWGSLHLGYAGNADPEPGRCRRTDGKKWRCSRDAVPDQKYCERHINRGRHRSRKHVEGRTANAGQAPTKPAATPGTNGGGLNAAATHTSVGDLNRVLLNEPSKADHIHGPQSLSLLTSTNQRQLETSFVNRNKPEKLFEAPNGWTQIENARSNATQLSIAIPVDPSDFSSSSSPSHDNLTLAPLALSQSFNSNIPMSWESSVGGPLGEVLNKSNANHASKDQSNNCGSLNLSTDSWDLSPNLNLSPTGVLQKNNFGSVSSSNASSPRPDNGVICSDPIGSLVTKPQSITLL